MVDLECLSKRNLILAVVGRAWLHDLVSDELWQEIGPLPTFVLAIGEEPSPGGYWTNGNDTPEGSSSDCTSGDCSAQWTADGTT